MLVFKNNTMGRKAISSEGSRIAAKLSTFVLAVPLVMAIVGTGNAQSAAQNQDDVVLRWNQAILDAIRFTKTPPPVAARALAITHTCIFDAWAAYDDVAKGTRLGGSLRRPKAERTLTNQEKAISFAAYRALTDLFPSQKTTLLDPIMSSLGFDPSDTSRILQDQTFHDGFAGGILAQ